MSDTWWGPSIKYARPIDRGHALAHEALVIRRIERGDPNVILVGSNVFVDCSFVNQRANGLSIVNLKQK